MICLHPTRWLTLASVLLVIAHAASQYSARIVGRDQVYGLVPLFDLDREANVPTWFSSFLLLSCAALLALVTTIERSAGGPHAGRWAVLGAIFLLLAVDETAQLHDLLTRPMREAFDIEAGYLYYAWVVPAALVLPLLGMAYLPFLKALPAASRHRFVAAGFLYLAGAWGVELFGGRWITEHGRTLEFFLIVTLEEILELAGLLVFFDALTRYLSEQSARFTLHFGPAAVVRFDTGAGTRHGTSSEGSIPI